MQDFLFNFILDIIVSEQYIASLPPANRFQRVFTLAFVMFCLVLVVVMLTWAAVTDTDMPLLCRLFLSFIGLALTLFSATIGLRIYANFR
jgi:hypothetical protein